MIEKVVYLEGLIRKRFMVWATATDKLKSYFPKLKVVA
jgi:hypothetical protein